MAVGRGIQRIFRQARSPSSSTGSLLREWGTMKTYARRRARSPETVGNRGGGGFGSSETTPERSLPWTECTGLRAAVQPSSADPFSLKVWGLTKLSTTDSRSLLGVARRIDWEDQKISGVNPLRRW